MTVSLLKRVGCYCSKHNPNRFMEWIPVFQNTRQALINWYHCTFVLLPCPPQCHLPGMGSSAQRGPFGKAGPAQMGMSWSWLAQNCQGFRHCPDEHIGKTDCENHCKTGSALTHNILEEASAGHKTECLQNWNIQILKALDTWVHWISLL